MSMRRQEYWIWAALYPYELPPPPSPDPSLDRAGGGYGSGPAYGGRDQQLHSPLQPRAPAGDGWSSNVAWTCGCSGFSVVPAARFTLWPGGAHGRNYDISEYSKAAAE